MENQLTTQPTKPQSLKAVLNSPAIKNKFEEMLGKKSASFLSSVISAVSANTALSKSDPMSVVSAAAIAASLDLPINSSLGFAHIVPYNTKVGKEWVSMAQFQMGWKGFVQLALRSGQYRKINLTPVYNGQIKKHNLFTGDIELSETPVTDFSFENQIGYLLYFSLLNGYEKYFYMSKKECESHGKKYSQSFKKGYGLWVDNFEAMSLKTVAKLGLSRYGMLSVDMLQAIESDQAVILENEQIDYVDNKEETKQIVDTPDKITAQIEQIEDSPKEDTKKDPPIIDPFEKIDPTLLDVDKAMSNAGKAIKEKMDNIAADIINDNEPVDASYVVDGQPVPDEQGFIPDPEKPFVKTKVAKSLNETLKDRAAEVVVTCWKKFEGSKISEIPEEEMLTMLSSLDLKIKSKTKFPEEWQLFYSSACCFLDRKKAE